ncbi:MAG TPA: energy transducer TonB [Pyrinomonadaceae bacterium]|nr:energy transducer TonB [Pyrinomonadaceae bacterium]
MKHLLSAVLSLLVLGTAYATRAQAPDFWVKVSSPRDYFQVLMPHRPKEESYTKLKSNFGDLDIKVKSYQASAPNGATYRLWVLELAAGSGAEPLITDTYLDSSADVIWDGLLKSERDKLPDDRRATAGMAYVKELAPKPLPGREYTLTIGSATGTAQFYVTESRLYVLLAMNSIGATWEQEPFFQSFAVAKDVPGRLPIDSVEPGTPGTRVRHPNDLTDEKVFRSSEVTTRARVLSKPEPSYTESARKFLTTGTVVLRCVFSKDGKVTNLWVIRKLPHGLTVRAIDAARQIRFTPATKDGQPVSMWMQLEYNFNLY